jgi:hypothetical protein
VADLPPKPGISVQTNHKAMTNYLYPKKREKIVPNSRSLTSELKAKTGIEGKQLFLAGEVYAQLNLAHRTNFILILNCLGKSSYKQLLSSKGNVVALGRMATFLELRIRSLDSWSAPQTPPRTWLANLIDHLFAAYPTPICLNNMWFRQDFDCLEEWYFPVANGESLRNMQNTPIAINKKMAHLLRSENRMWGSPELMFRWVQLQAMGASQAVASQIMGSSPGQSTNQEEFWTPIFEFFVCHYDPESRISISEILDYIDRVYAVSEENRKLFRTRGRTMESLARATDEWHRELHATQYGVNLRWKPQTVKGYENQVAGTGSDAKPIKYFITELCSGPDLAKEGRLMGHCVASYQMQCAEGGSSIWSLRKRVNQRDFASLVTMEMDNEKKKLVQIRARFNASPDQQSLDVIRKWCGREGISISNQAI